VINALFYGDKKLLKTLNIKRNDNLVFSLDSIDENMIEKTLKSFRVFKKYSKHIARCNTLEKTNNKNKYAITHAFDLFELNSEFKIFIKAVNLTGIENYDLNSETVLLYCDLISDSYRNVKYSFILLTNFEDGVLYCSELLNKFSKGKSYI